MILTDNVRTSELDTFVLLKWTDLSDPDALKPGLAEVAVVPIIDLDLTW